MLSRTILHLMTSNNMSLSVKIPHFPNLYKRSKIFDILNKMPISKTYRLL